MALDVLHEAGKYPLITLPATLQMLFLTVLPVGLMAYLPSMLLLGKIGADWVSAWPFAAGAAFLTLAPLPF